MDQWKIEPVTRRCAATGRELADGDEYYGVLYEEADSFRREDYSIEAWTGSPEGAFCFFRSRLPVKEAKRRLLVDDDVLVSFFVRLGDVEEEAKLHFRFVLALILMRKRLLKYEETVHKDDGEYWQMRLMREPSEGGVPEGTYTVWNPQLSDRQIEAVSEELRAILSGGDPADEGVADGATSAGPNENGDA